MVVFGTVESRPGQTDVTPEFFVSARNLSGAEEFSGVYPLETIKVNSTDPLTVQTSNSQVPPAEAPKRSLSWFWG